MIVMATLNDRTRICPDRWLKNIEIVIYTTMNIDTKDFVENWKLYEALSLPVVDIKQPVQSQIKAQRDIDCGGIGRLQE